MLLVLCNQCTLHSATQLQVLHTTATTKASEAATSATNAATSATTATTKASEASTSATNCCTSATHLNSCNRCTQAAQAAAEAAADNFDDTYLGAKSSDPTVDNDGDALAAGDAYILIQQTMYFVYDGSAWKMLQ